VSGLLTALVLLSCSALNRPLPAPETDSGHPQQDSQPADSGTTERLPGWDTAPPTGLCTVSLQCGQSIPSEPKIPCQLRVEDEDGYLWYEGWAGVETRGRSTGGYDKAQYAVELWDEDQQDIETDLLAMGSESDWVLNGAIVDRALLRNQLAFDLYRAFDPERYAPESAYCTLTLDGEWRGIYFLTERIKRARERIDLDGDATDAGHAFVVKLDQSGGFVDNSAVGYGTWSLVSPRQSTASAEALSNAGAWLGGWQTALVSADPSDPETGIFAWLDMDAAVDFVILEEFTKNNDAYYLSVALWRRQDEPLHPVPWDLDLTLGQPTYNNNASPEEWVLYRPAWVANWGAVPEFGERLEARWRELRQGVLAEEAVLGRIDAYRAIMGDTVYDNFEVWPIEEIQFGSYLPERESYDEEYDYVRAWILLRLAWVDAHIGDW